MNNKNTRSAEPVPAPSTPRKKKAPKPLHIVRPAQENINLGERLRVARKARELSIAQVADAAGITKSFLSRLERDAVAASVATLIRVCNAIGIRPGSLFEAPETNIVRSGQGTPINLGGEAINEYLISGSNNEHMMALLSVIEPGGGSGSEPYTLNAGSDLVHVKEGELVIDVDGVSHHLKEGDTLTFPPSLPHSWVNPSSTARTLAVWVIVPPP